MVSRLLQLSILCLTTCLHSAATAEVVDPANDDSQYAYAANLGWINAEPDGNTGPGITVTNGALSGWLWSVNTGWISLSCENTDSCATVNYGVSLDGSGALSGYAWSPNLGWVSFSCADSSSCDAVSYEVMVDLSTGNMAGYAFAANAGWISFSCENSESCDAVEYRVRLDLEPPPEDVFMDGFEPT